MQGENEQLKKLPATGGTPSGSAGADSSPGYSFRTPTPASESAMPDSNDIAGKLSELLDQHMLKWLEEGTPLIDQEGRAVLDSDGNPIMRALTPSEADKIMKRLTQIAKGGAAGAGDGSASAALERAAAERFSRGELRYDGKPITSKIPPLDLDRRDAAIG